MSDEKLTLAQVKEIADALDRVADGLPWEQSVFLSAIGKKFASVRDEFKREVGLDEETFRRKKVELDKFSLQAGQQEVYVSVYNAQGANLAQWERIIANLVNQSVSRPIYSTEKAVKEMIRAKPHLINEGYVSVHINKSDLLNPPNERAPRDKLGSVLLLLKERTITKDRIRKFFHKSGIYEYKNGTLSRLMNMSFSEDV